MSHQDLDAPTQVQGFVSASEDALPEVDGYEIIREIGRGGMGCVYLAKQNSLDRLVALKMFHSDDPELAQVLVQEAQIVGKFEHPLIVPVIEVNVARQPWFFSMGYVGGEDLARKLVRGVIEPGQVVDIGIKLCEAVQYAHENNVLHLDIKPANILMDHQGQPRLTDFGLAALRATKPEGVFGTPQFMSPEQVLGKDDLGPQTDVYSIGAVLYAALTGSPPIVAIDQKDLALRIVSRQPRAIRDFGVRVPDGLSAIIFQCLEKSPAKRYASAESLRADLVAFRSGEPIKARPPSFLSRIVLFLRHHIFAASVSGSIVILLLVLVAWLLFGYFKQVRDYNQLQSQYDTLRGSLELLDRRQRIALESAVAKDHFEQGKVLLAGKPAAEAVLASIEEGEQPAKMLLDILTEFATLTGIDINELEPEQAAKAVLDSFRANYNRVTSKVDLENGEAGSAENPDSGNFIPTDNSQSHSSTAPDQ